MKTIKKPWGTCRCIYDDHTDALYHVSINVGGVSSHGALHRHRHMANRFYVVSGVLILFTEGNPAGRRLGPGDEWCVDSGVWHRFEAVTHVELIETYAADAGHYVSLDDIERQEAVYA